MTISSLASLGVLGGLCAALPAGAVEDSRSTRVDGTAGKAVTAMESGRSQVRVGAEALPAATVAEGLAAPANKTVLRVDRLQHTTNLDAPGARLGSSTQTNESMTAIDPAPAAVDAGRAIVDFQYPSEPGRFTSGTTQSVLDFRETSAGGEDALFQLGSSGAVVGNGPAEVRGAQPVVGTAYVIEEGGNAIATGGSRTPLGKGLSTATYVPSEAPPASQQWSVVDAGGGAVRLVNRADGTCLSYADAVSGEAVGSDVCAPGTVEWLVSTEASDTTLLTPLADPELGLASSGGIGQPGELQLADSPDDQYDSWSFHALDEPGGSAPTWSAVRADGLMNNRTAAPYDLAVGDLDQSVGADGQYHDEAFVVYADGGDNLQLGVVDYNANPSRLLFTPPDADVSEGYAQGTVGAVAEGLWYPGDVIAEVGDFDGDGLYEIAVLVQGGEGVSDGLCKRVGPEKGPR